MDEAASTKSPPYATVIKHDRRLRDYPMPDFCIPSEPVDPIDPPLLNVTFYQGEGAQSLPTGIGLLGAIIRLFSTDAMRELGKTPDFDGYVPFH